MNPPIHRFSLIALSLCLSLAVTPSFAVNAKLGMWEWTTSFNMSDASKGFPPNVYRSCITANNLVPLPPGNEHCKVVSHTITDDRVDWKLECGKHNQTYTHSGNLTYNKTSAMGQSQPSTNNSGMSTMILGTYIGRCK